MSKLKIVKGERPNGKAKQRRKRQALRKLVREWLRIRREADAKREESAK